MLAMTLRQSLVVLFTGAAFCLQPIGDQVASAVILQQQSPPSVHVPPQAAAQIPGDQPAFYRLGDNTHIARAAEPNMQFPPRPENGAQQVYVQQASYNIQESGPATPPQMPQKSLLEGDAPLLPASQALIAARNQNGFSLPKTSQTANPESIRAEELVPPPRTSRQTTSTQQHLTANSLNGPAANSSTMKSLPLPAPNNQTLPIPVQPGVPANANLETARVIGVKATSPVAREGIPAEAAGMYTSLPAATKQEKVAGTTQETTRLRTPATQSSIQQATPQAGPNSFSTGGETPAMKMSIPSLEIQAFGPGTVGIHKPVQYRIVCHNRDTFDAARVSVAIKLPGWVKVHNVNTTTGRKDKTEENAANQVNWMIDRIAAGQTQTMIVDVIATKPEMFDLAIDWAMQPVSSSSRINVTEPRLEMNIAGPNEVLFGETAIYNVTVRNPGTGTAERVVVMLPEALGGEKAPLDDIAPGQEKTFQVELLARAAGQLDLTTSAAAAGNLQASSSRNIFVRRPHLDVALQGPGMKYAGSTAEYEIAVSNNGDATGRDVVAAIALPPGVEYLDGIDGAELVETGLKWTIGTLDIGDVRRYKIRCQMNVDGQVAIELAARGSGEIAAVGRCNTMVETVADLVLTVEDQKGPLPLNQKVDYLIKIRNRGTRAAQQLKLEFMFSEGIEPTAAIGLGYQLTKDGIVQFESIPVIEPGQEMSITVTAQATKAGALAFRAQLTGTQNEVSEACEGTTRFYGDTASRTADGAASSMSNGIR